MNESTTPAEQVHSNKNIPWHPMFNRWLKGILTPADVVFDDEVQSISEPPMIDSRLRHDGTRWTERLAGLKPEEIFEALRPEDRELLVQQVERYLATQLAAVPDNEEGPETDESGKDGPAIQ